MIWPLKQPWIVENHYNSVTHPGTDFIPLPRDITTAKAYAPENCTVIQSGYRPSYEGNYLILQGKVKYYYFGHFAKSLVFMGARVKEGQPIGIIGDTGYAFGIHTHHEVRDLPFSSGRTDPEVYYKKYVKPKEKKDMLTTSQQNVIYRFYLGREPTKEARKYVGKHTCDQERERVTATNEYKAIPAAVKAGKHHLNDHLPKELREL